MSAYYGIHRSNNYLAHFGIKGMKWGVRKQRPVTGNGAHSSAYNNAKRKLGLTTLGGGIIGGSIYAATHKKEMNAINKSAKPKRSKDWMVTVDTRSRRDREAAGESGSRIKYHPNGLSKSDKRRFESNSKNARQAAQDATALLDAAEARRNKSFLGRHGFGKTQKEYMAARRNAEQAFSNYYDNLSKRQQRRVRRNWRD